MEEDIAPGLFKSIQTDFQSSLTKNRKIAAVQKKLDEGIATVQDCNSYAEEVGNALADAYKKNISSDNLPNGRLYYNIAERTIRPTMENNYELISDVTMQTLDEINRAAGIGLKAQKAELNEDRIRKLINIVTDAGHYDDVAGFLADPVVNFSRNVVDSTVQKNADFQYKAGLDTKVVRTLNGEKTCEWCQSKAGTYDYEDVKDTGNPVWQRHENCDCTIEYVTRKGRQTVFNYREDNTPEARARRKAIKNELQDDMNLDRIRRRKAYTTENDEVFKNFKLSASVSGEKSGSKRYELGRLDPSRAKEAIQYFNDEIRNELVEHAIVIDQRGNVIHFVGDETGVSLSEVNLKNAHVTHNHPTSNGIVSFGKDDFGLIIENQSATWYCVNPVYDYTLRVIKPIDDVNYSDLYADAMLFCMGGEDIQDKVMQLLANKGYILYDKRRVTSR